jgi:glycerol-3-phosphate dehydrogenase
VSLVDTHWGAGLAGVEKGFVYSDAWVDDARLVALNALSAAESGASIRTRTGFAGARREGDRWIATLDDGSTVTARAIVNTAGPWVGKVLGELAGVPAERPPRLVKGSHMLVRRLYEGEHAYIFQNDDKRIVFAIPYERDFTLIGTTDKPYEGDPSAPTIDPDEIDYLCRAVNRYFAKPVGPEHMVGSYSGVRPLFDDGAEDASAVTRDYVLKLGVEEGPQVLSAFGGKITTYRRLAEHALDKLRPFLPHMGPAWTADAPLPGGDLPGGDFGAFLTEVRRRWPFLDPVNAERMAHAYGTRIGRVLGDTTAIKDLGGGLSTREVDYLVAHEWARTAEDILWRRTKIGVHAGEETGRRVADYLAERG